MANGSRCLPVQTCARAVPDSCGARRGLADGPTAIKSGRGGRSDRAAQPCNFIKEDPVLVAEGRVVMGHNIRATHPDDFRP